MGTSWGADHVHPPFSPIRRAGQTGLKSAKAPQCSVIRERFERGHYSLFTQKGHECRQNKAVQEQRLKGGFFPLSLPSRGQ